MKGNISGMKAAKHKGNVAGMKKARKTATIKKVASAARKPSKRAR